MGVILTNKAWDDPPTRYLLKVLDAIWKNISEAVGVILVYFGRVVFLGATFSGPVCNAGITVVLACIAYVLSKEGKAKAKNSDVGDELNPNMYPDLTTSLLRHRSGSRSGSRQWTGPVISWKGTEKKRKRREQNGNSARAIELLNSSRNRGLRFFGDLWRKVKWAMKKTLVGWVI